MSEPWHITLLGELRVQRGEQVITRFKYQKVGGLLAYLAYFPRQRHSRDFLVEIFWSESSVGTARNNLSVALSSLRHQLEPPGIPGGSVLYADRYSVGLNPDRITTDVAEFELAVLMVDKAADPTEQARQWERAIQLYQGRLLPSYYEDWITAEQERLSGLFFDTVTSLITHLEQQGDLTTALRYVRQTVSVDPLKEDMYGHLMRLLAATGQPGAALRQFKTLERLLDEEMGETPSIPLRALALQIEKQSCLSTPETAAPLHSPPDASPADKLTAPSVTLTGQMTDLEGAVEKKRTTGNGERKGSLPIQMTRFFGREQEIARLVEMLHDEKKRFVTLTGPGGTGKTRLAIEAAERLAEAFRGAVWFVPLADINDPHLIADTVLDALHVSRAPQQEVREQIIQTLSQQPSLLVLDNFEHLVEEGAEIVKALLTRIPSLSVLVTSRQVLALSGEQEFAVSPLPTPGNSVTLERLTQIASVQLFVDRAQLVMPHFQITKHNTPAVAELCDRLEGIPLAIELAAARTQVIAPSQMLAQLQNRFDFLKTRKRDVSERHRSLRAAIEWSYRALSPELQRFFCRLSVFRGGWTAEAAEAVCEEPLALDYLSQLRESSLITTLEIEGIVRITMLETLREFAAEQLASTERENLYRRHVDFYLELVGISAEEEKPTFQDAAWCRRVDLEHDNILAALDWCLLDECVAEAGLEMVSALRNYWLGRGHLWEAQKRFATMLSSPGAQRRTQLRANALYGMVAILDNQNRLSAAKPFLEESLSIYRELNQQQGIATVQNALGWVRRADGDLPSAQQLHTASLAIFRTLGDRQGCAIALYCLGSLSEQAENYSHARTLFEEADRFDQEFESVGQARVALARIARKMGEMETAATLLKEVLHIFRDFGDIHGSLLALEEWVHLALLSGETERACCCLSAVIAARQTSGNLQTGLEPNVQEEILIGARRELGEATVTSAWEAGQAMNWKEAISYALDERES